jgi:hypothetical protein
MDNNLNFSQKIILVILQYVLPSVLALSAAILASNAKDASVEAGNISKGVNQRLIAIQARLDERDLLNADGWEKAVLFPVGTDQMWRDYYHLVTVKGITRTNAARQILKQAALVPNENVAAPAWKK